MKLPLSWMRDFVSIDAPVEEISRRLSFAGLVVENVEKLTPGFAGVFTISGGTALMRTALATRLAPWRAM